MDAAAYLKISSNGRIAYHNLPAVGDCASLPGLIFLGGFKSDMTGVKATTLHAWARDRGRAYVRFDYRGHGQSSDDFENGCIGDWADDAAEVLTRLTTGPQILVGSSMGGWIAMLLARRFPERVAGLVGIAAAPDFTQDGMAQRLSPDQRAALERDGRVALPSEYSDEPYVITRRLIEDGRNHLLLRTPLRLDCPVRLLHGTADADVPVSVAQRLFDHMESPDARLTMVKGADHRFSDARCMRILVETIDGLTLPATPG